jgi:hypothetical protein
MLSDKKTRGLFAAVMIASSGLAPAEPPRAASSVHLVYAAPPGAVLFHNEMAVTATTPGSFFMPIGWKGGYFGLQELADGARVILFSVWDPAPGDDPHAVQPDERVECVSHAPEMRIRRFGGEGTGGQCMGPFAWSVGETNRFVVTATADGQKTVYAGYVWSRDLRDWKHLVTFRARAAGSTLRGLHAFVEDFRRDGLSVHDVRRARFGNGWTKTADGEWAPVTRARFTASCAAPEDQDRICAGVEGGWFSLAAGGDARMVQPLWSMLIVPPPPADSQPEASWP